MTRIQPSELMKIAMPLLIAWYFQRREGARTWADFAVAAALAYLGDPLVDRLEHRGIRSWKLGRTMAVVLV